VVSNLIQDLGFNQQGQKFFFVDYIMEHLKPTGRAGIVVPEGIIFQTGNAYKTLRKKLVEDCLVGVISLPAGVFQPYSGVKTSILILDKELNQKSDNIFFAKIENDGFSLGAQRTAMIMRFFLLFIKKTFYLNRRSICQLQDTSKMQFQNQTLIS
jgi:type I restriction-modification system DNA methylase subunit